MDVQTAPNPETAQQEPLAKRHVPSALGWAILFFAVAWAALYGLWRELPYLKNGSDVVFSAKLQWEHQGQVFPADPAVTRVLIFGNSKILAGFVPAWFDHLFDQMSSADHLHVSSFNSGFPGSDLFLPPLQAMCARGQAPNVLLMTLPWSRDPRPRGIFHFIPDDHAVIDELFPFRNLLRDLTAFLLAAPSHGGVMSYYRESEQNERDVIAERGYHLITEQSRFAGGRLPDDFHLASDLPTTRLPRIAPSTSAQIAPLNQLIRQHHIDCYFVPFYLREGEAAPAEARDSAFAAQVEQATPCKLLGPDYYLYPNRLFADQTHLNQAGARVYTEALFQLLKDRSHALQ
ncbi:MAG: hypothetical protein QOH35_5123 [Acidobacteriaceae bacterium]|nr:hypothetical protein [Acidobacteriaceae bacterium]